MVNLNWDNWMDTFMFYLKRIWYFVTNQEIPKPQPSYIPFYQSFSFYVILLSFIIILSLSLFYLFYYRNFNFNNFIKNNKNIIFNNKWNLSKLNININKWNIIKTADQIAYEYHCNFSNKWCIITGATDGLGKELCHVILKYNGNIIMAVRDREKAEHVRRELITNLITQSYQNKTISTLTQDDYDKRIIILTCDMLSLQSIYDFANNIYKLHLSSIDYLINNAGIMSIPNYQLSKDDYEIQFQTNYLSHYYLTRLLINKIIESKGRIINVTSVAHKYAPEPFSKWIQDHFNNVQGITKEEYSKQGFREYAITKACQILFTHELVKKYCNNNNNNNDIKIVCCHPGDVDTKIWNYNPWFKRFHYSCLKWLKYLPFEYKSVEQGASCILYCMIANEHELINGHYYRNCYDANNDLRKDMLTINNSQELLWKLSEELITKKSFKFDIDHSHY